MADKYTGINIEVLHGSTDLSDTIRTVELDPRAAEPDIHDNTVRGATARTEQEGLAGAIRTRVTLGGVDETGGVSKILDLAVNDQDTLYIYPESNTTGKESVTISSARLLNQPRTFSYEELTFWRAEFLAVGGPTYGTVS